MDFPTKKASGCGCYLTFIFASKKMRLAGYAEENLCYYKIIRTNKFFHEITSNLSILRILGTGRWLRRYRINNGEIDMYKILVVDDDPIILDDNQTFFRTMGYDVICSSTAAHAEEIILSNALDCVILDVDLPDRNGFSLCEKIRTKTGIPIVFLSGYTEEESRIRGLTVGGDDYVCKPYSLRELELRVQARIRAGRAAEPPRNLTYGSFCISPATCSASYESRSVDFSSYEFDVLYFLARHPGEIFTPDQIYDSVWNAPINKGQKSLQVIMGRIRKKLYELCPDHDYIQTKRYKGYLFVPE